MDLAIPATSCFGTSCLLELQVPLAWLGWWPDAVYSSFLLFKAAFGADLYFKHRSAVAPSLAHGIPWPVLVPLANYVSYHLSFVEIEFGCILQALSSHSDSLVPHLSSRLTADLAPVFLAPPGSAPPWETHGCPWLVRYCSYLCGKKKRYLTE